MSYVRRFLYRGLGRADTTRDQDDGAGVVSEAVAIRPASGGAFSESAMAKRRYRSSSPPAASRAYAPPPAPRALPPHVQRAMAEAEARADPWHGEGEREALSRRFGHLDLDRGAFALYTRSGRTSLNAFAAAEDDVDPPTVRRPVVPSHELPTHIERAVVAQAAPWNQPPPYKHMSAEGCAGFPDPALDPSGDARRAWYIANNTHVPPHLWIRESFPEYFARHRAALPAEERADLEAEEARSLARYEARERRIEEQRRRREERQRNRVK